MNRSERRELQRAARGDRRARWCPQCGAKRLFVALAVGNGDIGHFDVYCSVCEYRLGRTVDGQNGVNGAGIIDGRKWEAGDSTARAKSILDAMMNKEEA